MTNLSPFKPVNKPVFECYYTDFEEFVENTLGLKDYSLVVAEELSNDMVYDFEITGDLSDNFDADDEDEWQDEVLKGDYQYKTRLITQRLHEMGLLPDNTMSILVGKGYHEIY